MPSQSHYEHDVSATLNTLSHPPPSQTSKTCPKPVSDISSRLLNATHTHRDSYTSRLILHRDTIRWNSVDESRRRLTWKAPVNTHSCTHTCIARVHHSPATSYCTGTLLTLSSPRCLFAVFFDSLSSGWCRIFKKLHTRTTQGRLTQERLTCQERLTSQHALQVRRSTIYARLVLNHWRPAKCFTITCFVFEELILWGVRVHRTNLKCTLGVWSKVRVRN